jgi:hypothetical protein
MPVLGALAEFRGSVQGEQVLVELDRDPIAEAAVTVNIPLAFEETAEFR